MLGILDHNLTTVTLPMLETHDASLNSVTATLDDRKTQRDAFDSAIFGSKLSFEDNFPSRSSDNLTNSSSLPASYSSIRLLALQTAEEDRASPSVSASNTSGTSEAHPGQGVLNVKLSTSVRSGNGPSSDQLMIQRQTVRSISPAPSSLSASRSAREVSPSRLSEPSNDASSGASTPKVTPARPIKAQGRKSSFASRFASSWLYGALGQRSQPSFPTAAPETVGRHDVSIEVDGRAPSPKDPVGPGAQPRPVPGAPVVTPSTPSPVKGQNITQPVPIASQRFARMASEEQLSRSQRNAVRLSRSPVASSWGKVNAFNRSKTHVTLNPCNPKENIDVSFGEGRRWQHVRPRPMKDSQHLVKWASMSAPACLPLTTDFMPTPSEIQDFYEVNSYDIACYPDQVSFLIRSTAAHVNLPLAVMREMASQRLSRE